MADTILEVKNLKKYFSTSFGDLHAVDDVSFSVKRGQTIGIVGESGCGKSTLGRTILQFHKPTSGEVLFEGENIVGASKRRLKQLRLEMQMIFQDPYTSLNPRMSIQELIAEPLLINKLCGSRREVYAKVAELMDVVGLAQRLAGSYPHELDGGRRQRIGIARALAVDPKFIVCDEPVSALDVSIQAQILNLLMDLQEEKGLTYMFITHDLSVVRHISDSIMVMYLGKCVETAETKALFKDPQHPYTKALLSAIPVPDIRMRSVEIEPIQGEVTSPIDPPAGCRFASRCRFASDACRKGEISLNNTGDDHYVACHLKQREVSVPN